MILMMYDVSFLSFTALDGPFVDLSNPADAWPAILFHGCEIFKAVEIGGDA